MHSRRPDRRALGRAWLLAGFVYYKAVGWPTSTCVGEIAAAMYWGPTPVDVAVLRCESLLRDETLDLPGTAYLRAFLGGLVAQQQEFERARELVDSARTTLEDLGLRAAIDTYCTPLLGEIELLAGNASLSAQIFRELCDRLDAAKDFSHLASRAGDLAEALFGTGPVEDADEWTRVAEARSASDDLKAQMLWRPVRARIHARRGELAIAEELARQAVTLAEATDDLNRRAKSQRDLGDVLRLGGSAHDAASAFARALELYEQKGNLAGAARVRTFQAELALT